MIERAIKEIKCFTPEGRIILVPSKLCERCGKPFIWGERRNFANVKYCAECAATVKRMQNTERQRKARARAKERAALLAAGRKGGENENTENANGVL